MDRWLKTVLLEYKLDMGSLLWVGIFEIFVKNWGKDKFLSRSWRRKVKRRGRNRRWQEKVSKNRIIL